MAFRKVQGIGELNDLPKKIRPSAKAFDDAGKLLPSRAGTPEIICGSGLAGSFVVFDDANLRVRLVRLLCIHDFALN